MPRAQNLSKGNKTTKAPKATSQLFKGKAKASDQSTPVTLYSGFLPIPLILPSLTASSSSKSTPNQGITHYIYVRPHKTKVSPSSSSSAKLDEDLPSDKTAFVANIPVDATERDLRLLFGKWGVVESVDFTGQGDGDTLERAVLGLQGEEDDDSDDGSDEGDEDDEGELRERTGGTDRAGAGSQENRPEPTFKGDGAKLPRRLRSRRKTTLPASVPDVTPLPALDPRSTPFHPSGGRCAHVVFLDPLPLQRLMTHSGAVKLPFYGPFGQSISTSTSSGGENGSGTTTGLAYYLSRYTSLRPSLSAVKEYADSSMARFDHLHSLLLSSRARQSGVGALVDEDGFTVVVRGGRYGRTGGRGPGSSGVAVASKGFGKVKAGRKGVEGDQAAEEAKGKEGKRKGSGARPMDDFYRFQKTEKKRQELAGLRAKFEQDKAKVEQLKKAKRFRPY